MVGCTVGDGGQTCRFFGMIIQVRFWKTEKCILGLSMKVLPFCVLLKPRLIYHILQWGRQMVQAPLLNLLWLTTKDDCCWWIVTSLSLYKERGKRKENWSLHGWIYAHSFSALCCLLLASYGAMMVASTSSSYLMTPLGQMRWPTLFHHMTIISALTPTPCYVLPSSICCQSLVAS